jgi:hypothetical protein
MTDLDEAKKKVRAEQAQKLALNVRDALDTYAGACRATEGLRHALREADREEDFRRQKLEIAVNALRDYKAET